MEILYLLIPVSIALVFVIGAVFWWALDHDQFDGLDEEANRIFDETLIDAANRKARSENAENNHSGMDNAGVSGSAAVHSLTPASIPVTSQH